MLFSNAQAEHSYAWLCTGMVSRRLVRQRNGKAWHGDGKALSSLAQHRQCMPKRCLALLRRSIVQFGIVGYCAGMAWYSITKQRKGMVE